jgi:hypothetical protein
VARLSPTPTCYHLRVAFMRIKRRLPILFGFLVFVAAVAAVVELRKHAPPEPARLLPGGDGFVYIDLKWMRRADIAGHLPTVPHDPEYEQFIQSTGFQFERDLQEAAVAIHYASPETGGETRFSQVLIAKIDGDKLRSYMKSLAASVEEYRSIIIYSIPLQNRTLRVAILGVDAVAASNHPDPLVIRGIIDRSHKLASPFGGPALLRQYYKHVPLASLVWGIFRTGPKEGAAAPVNQTVYGFTMEKGATVVASVRYLGAVHFKAEAFAKSEQSAEQLTTEVNSFLAIFRSAEVSIAGKTPDPDISKALDSLKVEQKKDRAVLTAIVPVELIRKAVSELPAGLPVESSPKSQR